MQRRIRFITIGLATLTGLAACGRGATPAASDDLKRDLDLASGQGLQLAPTTANASLATDLENAPAASPAPSPHKAVIPTKPKVTHRVTPKPAPQLAAREEPVPTPEAPIERSPEPQPVPQPQPAPPRPAPAPVISPAPRGGYRSVGEVIRNAPFPINP